MLTVISGLAIVSLRKRGLVALLCMYLCSICRLIRTSCIRDNMKKKTDDLLSAAFECTSILCHFFVVKWVGLWYVSTVFAGHTHCFFFTIKL